MPGVVAGAAARAGHHRLRRHHLDRAAPTTRSVAMPATPAMPAAAEPHRGRELSSCTGGGATFGSCSTAPGAPQSLHRRRRHEIIAPPAPPPTPSGVGRRQRPPDLGAGEQRFQRQLGERRRLRLHHLLAPPHGRPWRLQHLDHRPLASRRNGGQHLDRPRLYATKRTAIPGGRPALRSAVGPTPPADAARGRATAGQKSSKPSRRPAGSGSTRRRNMPPREMSRTKPCGCRGGLRRRAAPPPSYVEARWRYAPADRRPARPLAGSRRAIAPCRTLGGRALTRARQLVHVAARAATPGTSIGRQLLPIRLRRVGGDGEAAVGAGNTGSETRVTRPPPNSSSDSCSASGSRRSASSSRRA